MSVQELVIGMFHKVLIPDSSFLKGRRIVLA